MSEWLELKTMFEVAEAQMLGEEIQISVPIGWENWKGNEWSEVRIFRSRPAKKVKKVVLREGLRHNHDIGYYTQWYETPMSVDADHHVRWLDTPERVIEVES